MKKSLLALAALGAFAGAASAQSSVTLYGRLDQAYGKAPGSVVSGLFDPSGSRIGLKGEEDLGGGLKAVFNIEHRFYADDGTAGYGSTCVSTTGCTTGNFWGARSVVGLKGGFGQILLGREYTAAFLTLENPMDPWKGDTLASLKYLSLGFNRLGGSTVAPIDPARYSNAITYTIAAEGFTGMAQWAPKEGAAQKNPWSIGVNYAAGPIFVALAHTNPGDADDKWTTVAASYDLSVVKLGALYGTGTNTLDQKVHTWALTAVAPLGNGQIRSSYGQTKNKDVVAGGEKPFKRLAVGYWYSLSKRTTLYADVINDNGFVVDASGHSKTGYELGLKHDF